MKALSNRPAICAHFKKQLDRLEIEARTDEGAAKFFGEVNSVYEALVNNKPDAEVIRRAEYVGLASWLVGHGGVA